MAGLIARQFTLAHSIRTRFRRLAFVLSLAQLAIFAGAPVFEAFATRAVVTVESGVAGPQAETATLAHDPEACAACALMHAKVASPSAPNATLLAAVSAEARSTRERSVPHHTPDASIHSRAPPVRAA